MVSVARKVLPGRHEDIVAHFESLGVSLRFASEAASLKEALWLVTQNAGVALMTRVLCNVTPLRRRGKAALRSAAYGEERDTSLAGITIRNS